MTINVFKKGIRALGIAESFQRDNPKSILAGVAMRGDLQIDGISLTSITVGGVDATEGVLRIFNNLNRKDLNVILLNGCVISWFNIIDLNYVHEELSMPILCVTYEESEGLKDDIKRYFKDWDERLEVYNRLGQRSKVKLNTGYEVFLRFYGLDYDEVKVILNRFTTHGKVCEPLRTAKILARAVLNSGLITPIWS